jgi:predicted DNA-binding protein with PD1-like motif
MGISTASFLLACIFATGASALALDCNSTSFDEQKARREKSRCTIAENRVGAVINKHKTLVERLKPGDDLHSALKRIASQNKVKAGVIISAVGSLKEAALRFAGANEGTKIAGPLEVVSVTGTISDESMHVHLSVSDSAGKTTGGHLLHGCKVFTTIELVILDLSDEWTFDRTVDEQTKYLELNPRPNPNSTSNL